MYDLLPTPPIKGWPSLKPWQKGKAQPKCEAPKLKKQKKNGAEEDETRCHDKSG
jgi:hypothetical protein